VHSQGRHKLLSDMQPVQGSMAHDHMGRTAWCLHRDLPTDTLGTELYRTARSSRLWHCRVGTHVRFVCCEVRSYQAGPDLLWPAAAGMAPPPHPLTCIPDDCVSSAPARHTSVDSTRPPPMSATRPRESIREACSAAEGSSASASRKKST
jgi:hypothetical protein